MVAEANRRQDEPDALLPAYESIGADAELDYLIYDGSSYGTATVAGSAEEADYLGLPGLLNAEQMRVLLQQRQEEQLKAASERARQQQAMSAEAESDEATAGVTRIEGSAYPRPQRVASEVVPKLRKELNTLVSMTAATTW